MGVGDAELAAATGDKDADAYASRPHSVSLRSMDQRSGGRPDTGCTRRRSGADRLIGVGCSTSCLSASTEVQDQAAIALAKLLDVDEIATSTDAMECLEETAPRAQPPPCRPSNVGSMTKIPSRPPARPAALASIGGKQTALRHPMTCSRSLPMGRRRQQSPRNGTGKNHRA